MLLEYIILCLPLALLPSIFPDSDRFSMPFLRMMCPKNVIFLFLMVCNSSRFMFAIVDTRSFDTLSVHAIFSIILISHNFVASKHFCITDEILHVSHPYYKLDFLVKFNYISFGFFHSQLVHNGRRCFSYQLGSQLLVEFSISFLHLERSKTGTSNQSHLYTRKTKMVRRNI